MIPQRTISPLSNRLAQEGGRRIQGHQGAYYQAQGWFDLAYTLKLCQWITLGLAKTAPLEYFKVTDMIDVIQLSGFRKATKKLFTEAELTALIEFVGTYPGKGNVIPGTGGLRKLR